MRHQNSFLTALLSFALGLWLVACGGSGTKSNSDSGTNPPSGNQVDIYVVGAEFDSRGNEYPVLWKNGTIQRLGTGSDYACAYSVFVSGNDVYVAGHEDDKPKLWRNGTGQNLSNSYGYANSVFVANSNIYVAGGEGYACLWTNGNRQYLKVGAWEAQRANSVFVSGNDVYVAGDDDDRIVVWKNNSVHQMITAEYVYWPSVTVSGSDVYVAGYEYDYPVAKLWKNGVRQNLAVGSGDSFAHFVHAAGSDVYVAGSDSNSQGIPTARLWKNSIAQNLGTTAYGSEATSVYVFGSDVYVAGYEFTSQGIFTPIVWKNGSVLQRLTSGSSNAGAMSIFVK